MGTVYYTAGFDKELYRTNNIIYLNVGDFISLKETHYTIVWKIFNAEDNIMIYHCNAT